MDKLNEYNLLDIFSYLDGESLKKASLVNKSWNRIISSNAATMKKLKLSIFPEDYKFNKKRAFSKKQLEVFTMLKRKYKNAILDEARINRNIIPKFKNQFKYLCQLEIINCELTEAAYKRLLISLVTLEKLIMVDSILLSTNAKESDKHSIELPSLKSLVFANSSWRFIQYIGKTKLQVLKIHHNLFNEIGVNSVKQFLVQQSSTLKELAFRVNSASIFKIFDSNELKELRLSQFALTLFDLNQNTLQSVDNISDFLVLQKESLQHFETGSSLPETIYECIFSKLQVKSLTLPANFLPNQLLFYNAIRRNEHLKKLVLLNELKEENVLIGMLDLFNKIEELYIQHMRLFEHEVCERIFQKIVDLNHLKILKIPFLFPSAEATIPTLKTLQIEEFVESQSFENFVINQRNLENLAVKWIDGDLTESIETVSAQLHLLKKLSFGSEFIPTIRLIEVLRNNCPKLRVIELLKNEAEPITEEVLRVMNESMLHVYTYSSVNAMKIFDECKTVWDFEEDNYAIASLNTDMTMQNIVNEFEDETDNEDMDFYDEDDFDFDDDDNFDFDDIEDFEMFMF
ncbi:hypothetical protein PVAND_001813 [Polypedilum vanderplanki]|uniref:F-box domain-containing protein n=1 Tax=Polypedilum vanderplanki TaxID=319348 RepID=A0A9J6BP40_POLVA|nr:hypothetical protein PVAND_001813 [Polypedilum vanderplanki]